MRKTRKTKRRGFGASTDVHMARANEHLYRAHQYLAQSLKAKNCEVRVQNAIEAFGQAVAADVNLASAGEKALGERVAVQAVVAIRSCVPTERVQDAPRRKLQLIRGGR